MIGVIPLFRAARVVPAIRCFLRARLRSPKDVSSSRAHTSHNGALLLLRQSCLWQRDGKNLIGPQRGIFAAGAFRGVDHVEAKLFFGIPKFRKAGSSARRQIFVLRRAAAQDARESRHGRRSIEPQCIHLDGFSDTRRHDAAVDLCVHPGKLHARLARIEQPVRRIDMDVVARAAHMCVDDFVAARETIRSAIRCRWSPSKYWRSASKYHSVASTVL